MASVEWAFLAEFAKVEPNATITAVGAGIRGIAVPVGHEQIILALAGMIAREPNEAATTLTVVTEAPDKIYSVSQSIEIEAASGDGEWSITVFAVQIGVPIAGSGKYCIRLDVDGASAPEIDLWVQVQDVDRPPVVGE